MILENNKRSQAAIEFLMTYGWMLLIVLIVGALIFSLVDFGSLLPNNVDLNNNLKGTPSLSVAYSKDSEVINKNLVKVRFKYTGAKKTIISVNNSYLLTELGDQCNATSLINLDIINGAVAVPTSPNLSFLNSQEGLVSFNCSNIDNSVGLVRGDSITGTLRISIIDPKSKLDIPSTGYLRLGII